MSGVGHQELSKRLVPNVDCVGEMSRQSEVTSAKEGAGLGLNGLWAKIHE